VLRWAPISRGDVAALAELAAPSIGLITNAGAEHLEGFGSLEGAARAEGELIEALTASGIAVINADDEFAPLWRGMTRAQGRDLRPLGARRCGARRMCTATSTRGLQNPFHALLAPRARAGRAGTCAAGTTS
jgi:UDP-N-acetylmuramate-alanine ligase